MGNSERDQYMRERILSILSSIERRLGVMAHEIPEIRDDLRSWQDGELKTSYFNFRVCEFFDSLNFD